MDKIPEKNPCGYKVPCRDPYTVTERILRGREPPVYDALPRNVTYAYMPPAYYAKGYRILPAYRKEFDFTEMKKLLFLEDPDLVHKWGSLRARLPYPENRVVDLPGTRDLHYKNYCMRALTPESITSWRKSIAKHYLDTLDVGEEKGGKGPAVIGERLIDCPHGICPFR